jgi:hypothetical protein
LDQKYKDPHVFFETNTNTIMNVTFGPLRNPRPNHPENLGIIVKDIDAAIEALLIKAPGVHKGTKCTFRDLEYQSHWDVGPWP